MNPVRLRIAVSSFIFILFLLLFCGPEKISVFLSQTLPPFQFVPALVRTITAPATLFVFGFVLIIVITAIFGRIYCSFLCPLGAMQDFFIALSKKAGWHKTHAFQKPLNLLRYSVLGLTIITAALGSMTLLNLLDPYSLAGRLITQFILPLFILIVNTAIGLLKYFDIYFFSKDTIHPTISSILVNTGLFLLILILSFRYGRLYCNSLCPVGAFLGLISRVSFFRFAIDKTGCIGCGDCESVCKAGCIDIENASIDQSRCVSCFNCVSACPQSVVNYRSVIKQKQGETWSPVRRGFLIGSIAAAAYTLSMFNSGLRNMLSAVHASSNLPVTPPGSASLEHFTKSCTACHLCVSACPTKVLTPSLLEYGAAGLLQPKMNYPESYCEYECTICGRVCPTGAILPISPDEKKVTQIGVVDLLKDKCVVYVNHQNCGACVEVCPTKTITFTDKDNILYPDVDNKYCIGCGACSKACPTTPKSIVVRANPVHKKAIRQVSVGAPVKQKDATPKDFPF